MDVPFDVLKIVASYITKHKMKLLDWLDINDIDLGHISGNPNAVITMATVMHILLNGVL
jgi:hypothetical protein